MRRGGMGSHEKTICGETDIWLTPPDLLAKLGSFDLDPCACSEPRPWPTAEQHIAPPDDGLGQPWAGRVWCNPPYGRMAGPWMERLAQHGNGTALVFARTETEMWHTHIWAKATAVLFLKGRLQFYRPDGTKSFVSNAGAPSALIAYGHLNALLLAQSSISGHFQYLGRA